MKLLKLLLLLIIGLGSLSVGGDKTSKFVYVANVANSGSNLVTGYSVDAATGTLTVLRESPFQVGLNPSAIVITPSGSFALVSNFSDSTVSILSVDRGTGTLTQVAGSPVPTGPHPGDVAIDASERFVYTANRADEKNPSTVSGFTFNSKTGVLTEIAGSPFRAGTDPRHVAVTPDSRFAYVTNQSNQNEGGSISEYAINGTTGALTELKHSPFHIGSQPSLIVIHPSGAFAYVANNDANQVDALSIDSVTGDLAPLPGSPFAAGIGPNGMAIDPQGEFLYVTNHFGATISGYLIDQATGSLMDVPGSPFAGRSFCRTAAVDLSGQFLYVGNGPGANNVSAYTINRTTGTITENPNSPFFADASPFSITTSPF
jgi:6-phosphogluconolactonase